ncbi:unnamed protein product, partial [Pylaiella littoralis]
QRPRVRFRHRASLLESTIGLLALDSFGLRGARPAVCVRRAIFNEEEAKLFGDSGSYAIMASTDPSVHKSPGRGIRPFDYAKWETHRSEIALTGKYAKFAQKTHLAKHLLATGDRLLAEASPYDMLWGIDIPASHPHAAHPSKWKGKNLLGDTLMRVR